MAFKNLIKTIKDHEDFNNFWTNGYPYSNASSVFIKNGEKIQQEWNIPECVYWSPLSCGIKDDFYFLSNLFCTFKISHNNMYYLKDQEGYL